MKRVFDIIFSCFGLLILLPFFLIISCWVALDSKGGVFYKQERIGKNRKPFQLLKFRTMRPDSFGKGALTIGSRDPRITGIGYYLRKFKLDELPQLLNVLQGDMSFVGPRPEVKKYVDMYSDEQLKVLSVSPGITDYASIKFRNESDLLATAADPEKMYTEEIMPEKLRLNLEYINDNSVWKDVMIIFNTFYTIIKE